MKNVWQNIEKTDQSRFFEIGTRRTPGGSRERRSKRSPYTESMGLNLRFKANFEAKTHLPVISYIPTP